MVVIAMTFVAQVAPDQKRSHSHIVVGQLHLLFLEQQQ